MSSRWTGFHQKRHRMPQHSRHLPQLHSPPPLPMLLWIAVIPPIPRLLLNETLKFRWGAWSRSNSMSPGAVFRSLILEGDCRNAGAAHSIGEHLSVFLWSTVDCLHSMKHYGWFFAPRALYHNEFSLPDFAVVLGIVTTFRATCAGAWNGAVASTCCRFSSLFFPSLTCFLRSSTWRCNIWVLWRFFFFFLWWSLFYNWLSTMNEIKLLELFNLASSV